MSKGECSGKRDPLAQTLPGSRTVPAPLALHPPMSARIPEKDKGSVTTAICSFVFGRYPDTVQPSQATRQCPAAHRCCGGTTYWGQQATLSSEVDTILLLTLGAGAGDLSPLLVQIQPPDSTLPLHPPTSAPGPRRGCLCRQASTWREKEGQQRRVGPGTGLEGASRGASAREWPGGWQGRRQPAEEPGKTGGGFAMAMLSLDAHGGHMDVGQGGQGVQIALEAQRGVRGTAHTSRVQHQKTKLEKPTAPEDVSKNPRGSVRAKMIKPWAPRLLALC